MKIAFILTGNILRKSQYNGHEIRYNGVGVSGTEFTQIVVAEQLAKAGHNVVMCSPMFIPSRINDVLYTKQVSDIIDAEVIINIPWYTGHRLIFPNLHTLIIHFHCVNIANGLVKFIKENTSIKRIMGVYNSEWCKQMEAKDPYYHVIQHDEIIGNPLMSDIIHKVDQLEISKTPRSVIFTATWERGGHVALQVYDHLKQSIWKDLDSTFTAMDYYMCSDFPKHRKDITCILSADKETVYKQLAQSEYFIYPLALQDHRIHKDTFACCVAEAVAMGVIVITWPIATLPDTYKDMIVFVDPPTNYNPDIFTMTHCRDHSLISKEAIAILMNKVIEIENNPELKKELQTKGKEKVRQLYSDEVIGSKWIDLMTRISRS